MLKRPCPETTTPSIQGIGLYTHVAGPVSQFPHERFTQKASDPVFLHIGCSWGAFKDRNTLEGPISEDVKRVWNDVQEAVDKEGEYVGQGRMSIDQLKERYGALDVPNGNASTPPMQQPQTQLQQIADHMQSMAMTGIQSVAGSVGQQESERRPSLGAGVARDVVMGGTDQERRASTTATSTGNTYEAARDPRVQRRKTETRLGT